MLIKNFRSNFVQFFPERLIHKNMLNILGKIEFYPKNSRFRKKIDNHLENCPECKEIFLRYRYLEMQKKAVFKNKTPMPAEAENRIWKNILNAHKDEKEQSRWRVAAKHPWRMILPAFAGIMIFFSFSFFYWISSPVSFYLTMKQRNIALSYVPGYYMLAGTTVKIKEKYFNKTESSKIAISEKIKSVIIFSKKDFENSFSLEKFQNPKSFFIKNTTSRISSLKISLTDFFFKKIKVFKFQNLEIAPIGTIFQFIKSDANKVFIQSLSGSIKIKSSLEKIDILQKGAIAFYKNNKKVAIRQLEEKDIEKPIYWYINRLSKKENNKLISFFQKEALTRKDGKNQITFSKKKKFKIIQNPNVRIIFVSGVSIIGKLLKETENKFIIKIQENRIEIKKENVKKLNLLASRLHIVPQPYIQLNTIDGDTIIGKLRKETKKYYIIQIQQNILNVSKKIVKRIQFLNE